MKNIFLILGIVLISSKISFAQLPINMDTDSTVFSESKPVIPKGKTDKAVKLYNDLGYKSSINMYTNLNKKGRLTKSDMNVIADSYRLNGDSENAEYWYAMFIKEAQKDIKVLYYAQSLLSNKKCEEAIKWFNVYASNNKEAARNVEFIESCNEMNTFQSHNDVVLHNINALNSPKLDFSPIPFKNGVVFTSSRGLKKRISKHLDMWTNDNFTDLFFAEKDQDGFFKAPVALKGNSNKKFHDGVATFNQGGTVMYFSRNDEDGKSTKDEINLKIYTSVLNSDDVWGSTLELPFNNNEFSNTHPTLSVDGKRLYFASDRPGGMGGMDIWVATMDNGNWSAPVNLGQTVNSSENEIFPQICADNVLLFASNGHKGFGGLDVFAVRKADDIDETSWEKRTNIGTPYNSNKDDFGFNMDSDHKSGFLTSNRVGGMGTDDIYGWNSSMPVNFFDDVPSAPMLIDMLVLDQSTKKPIHTVAVVMSHMDGSNKEVLKTNMVGNLQLNVVPNDEYRVEFQKVGYQSVVKNISALELLKFINEPYKVYMDTQWGSKFTGSMMNGNTSKPLSNATVTITNKCNDFKKVVKTDRNGKFKYFMDCGCEYELVGTKNKYTTDKKVVKTGNGDCRKQTVSVNLKVKKSPVVNTKNTVVRKLTGNSDELKVGQIIRLDKVYYDYNKATIRSDARPELDHVVNLMNTYPSMMIELGSHTDSRGKAAYNQSLSSRRASSVVSYLMNKGISMNRLKAVGYGENALVNGCADGTPCSEFQHQENRRTEIKITRLDNKNVKIQN